MATHRYHGDYTPDVSTSNTHVRACTSVDVFTADAAFDTTASLASDVPAHASHARRRRCATTPRLSHPTRPLSSNFQTNSLPVASPVTSPTNHPRTLLQTRLLTQRECHPPPTSIALPNQQSMPAHFVPLRSMLPVISPLTRCPQHHKPRYSTAPPPTTPDASPIPTRLSLPPTLHPSQTQTPLTLSGMVRSRTGL